MQKIPDMMQPVGETESVRLNFYDGHSRNIYITDQEFTLGSKVIFSTTDLEGRILKVNEPFIQASGWSEAELLGSPHYILRHPHMPKAAFKEMWDKLQATGHWSGYVKNLRKGGGYYWVHAMVHATKRDGKVVGYQSARHRITASLKQKYETLYAEMRHNEQ